MIRCICNPDADNEAGCPVHGKDATVKKYHASWCDRERGGLECNCEVGDSVEHKKRHKAEALLREIGGPR